MPSPNSRNTPVGVQAENPKQRIVYAMTRQERERWRVRAGGIPDSEAFSPNKKKKSKKIVKPVGYKPKIKSSGFRFDNNPYLDLFLEKKITRGQYLIIQMILEFTSKGMLFLPSNQYIGATIGTTPEHAQNEIHKLLKKKIIKAGRRGRLRTLNVNYNYGQWKELPKSQSKPNPKKEQLRQQAKMRLVAQLRQLPYSEYLKTDHWNGIRLAALARSWYRCQLCYAGREVKLDVHHRTYERRGREARADVIVLCHPCHEKFHDILEGSKK